MLSAVFPIVFIILALPVGYYVDKRGFRKAVLLGSAFFAVFGVLRVFVATFLLLLVFQTLAAVGQPFKDTPVKIIVEIVFTLSKYQHVIRCQFGNRVGDSLDGILHQENLYVGRAAMAGYRRLRA